MSSGYIAFIAILVLITVYIFIYRTTNEGFLSYTVEDTQAKAACAPKTLVRDPVQPDVAQLGIGTIQPSAETGSIPSSTYTPSRAAVLPYRNPGTEPARYIQILSVMQQIQAFFGFTAPALESECSPSIALPLQQARADLGHLITQVDVLEHNPGVPSSITSKELAQIMSNLRYLQKEARKMKTVSGTELLGNGGANMSTVEGFSASADPENDGGDNTDIGKTPATLAQLQSFKSAIESSIMSLKTATANSTDAITIQRLATLDRLRRDVEEIIISLERGDITASQVPIYADDIEGITARLGDTSKAVGTIIRNVSLPPAIAKLFPADMNWKDKITLQDIGSNIDSYMKDIAGGLSWSAGVDLKYDSPRALELAKAKALSPGGTDLYSADEDMTVGLDNTNGMLTKVQDSTNEIGALSREGGLNADGSRIIMADPPVGGFDWKERAGHVCASIKKAGMEPASFGCVNPKDVSETYSWRGNVAMVCNRLEGTTDPGLPVTMGCPPRTWDGLRT